MATEGTTTTTSTTTGAAGGAASGVTPPAGGAGEGGAQGAGTTTAAGGEAGKAGAQGATTESGKSTTTETKTTTATPEEITLKFAEGLNVDAALVKDFTATAKELGLKGEQAQKIADTFVKSQAAQEAARVQAFEQRVKGWADEVRADKELGGANFDATLKTAIAARDRFFPPEVKQLLDQSGFGNHPAFIRGFAAIGKAMAEDKSGGVGAGSPKPANSEEARLRERFPTMFEKKE